MCGTKSSVVSPQISDDNATAMRTERSFEVLHPEPREPIAMLHSHHTRRRVRQDSPLLRLLPIHAGPDRTHHLTSACPFAVPTTSTAQPAGPDLAGDRSQLLTQR